MPHKRRKTKGQAKHPANVTPPDRIMPQPGIKQHSQPQSQNANIESAARYQHLVADLRRSVIIGGSVLILLFILYLLFR